MHVVVRPDGALVDVPGHRQGTSPGVFIVAAGRSTITAHHADHATKRVDVDVAPGEDVAVELVLEPLASALSVLTEVHRRLGVGQ